MGPLRNTKKPSTGIVEWLTRLFPKDRAGPDRMAELHTSVLTRWAGEAKSTEFAPYRPGTLATVQEEIAAYQDQTTLGGEDRTRVA